MSLRRFLAALKHDIRFQFRQGFYYAYLLVTALYMAALFFVPQEHKAVAAVAIVFSDPSALGFFFIGGIILLEKNQGVIHSLFVTPLQSTEYILSKTLSLALLSLLSSLAVHTAALGLGSLSFAFIAGVVLTSSFFTLIGLGIALRCKTLNEFFAYSMATGIFFVPLMRYTGLIDSPVFDVLPALWSLALIGEAVEPASPASQFAAAAVLLVWITAGFLFAWTMLQRELFGKGRRRTANEKMADAQSA